MLRTDMVAPKTQAGLARTFSRLALRRLRVSLAVLAALAVVVSSLVFLGLHLTAERALTEQLLHREQVVARAGAATMANYFELLESALTSLAARPEVKSFGPESAEIITQFYQRWQTNLVTGVVLLDQEGVFLAGTGPSGETQQGISFADRDYFLWAKTAREGEFYLGSPVRSRIGTVKDQYIVTMTTPVWSQDQFAGAVTAAVLLQDLAQKYLEPLKLSADSRIFLVNSQGELLYGPYEKFIGLNYLAYLTQRGDKGSLFAAEQLAQAVAGRGKGTLDLILPDEQLGRPSRFLIAYTKAGQGSRQWTLAIAEPDETIANFYGLFSRTYFLALLVTILMIFSLTVVTIIMIRVAQKRAYLAGFNRQKWMRRASAPSTKR